jgi:DNA-binding CsgD family transcriptional regulator
MALIERDETLATLHVLAARAAALGQVVLVAGEAGVGKTSVLRAFAAAHAARGGAVWWGGCDALATPQPLAPLIEIVHDAAPQLAPLLAGDRAALFAGVVTALRDAPGPGSVLVVVEDVHWADDATLDLLKVLGRRIERTRALLALSYRDDEVGPSHPLRRLLGDFAPAARTYLPVQRLTAEGVATLAEQAGRRADGVHALTQGNAFFVTELLRDTPPGAGVPRSVQDVVLARFARLPEGAQALLRAVALVPGRAERWLADALLRPALADVEAALASGLLVADGEWLAYRHELGRVAIESSLSPPQAQALHRRVLDALQDAGRAPPAARLAHHALQARDTAAISRWAPAAAAQAAERGAHREARAQWRAAWRHGRPAGAAEQRCWLEGFVTAGLATGRTEEDLEAYRALEALARERGDPADAAWQRARQGQACIARLQHREAERLIGEAVGMTRALPPSLDKVRVLQVEAWRLMLERDCEASVDLGRQALALAAPLDDPRLDRALQGGIAVALMMADYPRGIVACEEVLAGFRRDGPVSGVVSLLSNMGSGSGEMVQLARAEVCLRETLALCRAHEIDAAQPYAQAWLALVRLGRGAWDETAELALEVVARPAAANDMSRLMALLALGRLRLRRGDPGAAEVLDEALALAAPSQTLQRIGPTHAARAEAAFTRGDPSALRAEVDAGLPLAMAKRHPWFTGELLYWRWRADAMPRDMPLPAFTAEPYAQEIEGRWREAADAWAALDCPYERARALALGDEAARREALTAFEALGARQAADALRRTLRDAGARALPRGPRAATRANPCGLTAAELRVLGLLAEGLRNAQIAERIHRSVRTVDHHVAAVLAKLDVTSRQAAIERARSEGWMPAA